MEFEGKVAIVTGAAGGIGKAITKQFVQNGATVIAWDISSEIEKLAKELNQEDEKKVIPQQIDLKDIPNMKKQVDDIYKEFGRIDILVNNAGVMQTIRFMEIDEQAWDHILDINLKSVFFLIQAVGKYMIKQNSGSIVNISSIAGRSGRPLAAHYSASKTGVLSVTKSAALAFGEHGVRVNAICPGVIVTPMMDQINQERARIFGKEGESDVAIQQFMQNIPLKELGYPKDIANTVVFLCSSKARYIHGQALNVCGGYEMD